MKHYYSPAARGFFTDEIHGARTRLVADPAWTRPTKRIPDPSWSPPLVDVADPDWTPPLVREVDPAWKRPTKRVKDPAWKRRPGGRKSPRMIMIEDMEATPATVLVEATWQKPPMISVPDPAAERPMIEVQDETALAPLVEEPNPDCRIPADAIEISAERYAELLALQGQGMAILPGPDGAPIAGPQPAPDPAELVEHRRRIRNRLLAASDWTQLEDVATTQPGRAAAWAAYRQALRDIDLSAEPFAFPASPE